jgi:hypothetical protein
MWLAEWPSHFSEKQCCRCHSISWDIHRILCDTAVDWVASEQVMAAKPDWPTQAFLDRINGAIGPHGFVARYMTDGMERISIQSIQGQSGLVAFLKRQRLRSPVWQLMDDQSRPVRGGGPANLRDLVPAVIKYLGL